MKARVLFGVFGFAFVLLALYVFPPIVLELVVAALCVFATYEVLGSTKLVRNHLELLLAMAVSLGLAVGHFSRWYTAAVRSAVWFPAPRTPQAASVWQQCSYLQRVYKWVSTS